MFFQLKKTPTLGNIVVTQAFRRKAVKGLIYFLHGACDNGVGFQTWINKSMNGNFAFQHFPVLYPSSPTVSYSLHDGKKESVWFDQLSLSPNTPEDWGRITEVGTQLTQLIKRGEKESGIPPENIIIGGFSMGGAMALHVGYKFFPNIAGVFALSSFLPPDSRLYETMEVFTTMKAPEMKFNGNNEPVDDLSGHAKYPKLFMSHGMQDPIVPVRWAKSTFLDIRKRGVVGHFYTIENSHHTINKRQLGLLHRWITDTLNEKLESRTSRTT